MGDEGWGRGTGPSPCLEAPKFPSQDITETHAASSWALVTVKSRLGYSDRTVTLYNQNIF